MADCREESMRDALPALRLGALSPAEAARVRAHVDACASCAAELEVLTQGARVFEQATPVVDVGRIVAALPRPPRHGAAGLRVVAGGARRAVVPRYVLAAAASLVLVAGLSLATLRERVGTGAGGLDTVADTAPVPAAEPDVSTGATAGLAAADELDGLGEQQLETLLQELDRLEATVAEDPTTLQRPVTGTTEGL